MDLVEKNQPHTVVIDLSATLMMDMDGDKTLANSQQNCVRKMFRFSWRGSGVIISS